MATGWLGWSDKQALRTPIDRILMAYEGRLDMLKAIFGSSEKDKPKPDEPSVSDKIKAAMRARIARQDADG